MSEHDSGEVPVIKVTGDFGADRAGFVQLSPGGVDVSNARTGLVRLAPGERGSWAAQQFSDGTGRAVERRRIIGRLGWQHVTWTYPDPEGSD